MQEDEYIGDEPDNEIKAAEHEEFKSNCKSYSDTKSKLSELNDQFKDRTGALDEQITHLQKEKQKVFDELFKEKIAKLNVVEQQFKGKIIYKFPEGEKSIDLEFGRFDLRTRKAIEIPSNNRLIETLIKKGLVEKAIKTFDTAWLKKVREADVLCEGEVNLIENKSLAFTPKKEGGK